VINSKQNPSVLLPPTICHPIQLADHNAYTDKILAFITTLSFHHVLWGQQSTTSDHFWPSTRLHTHNY